MKLFFFLISKVFFIVGTKMSLISNSSLFTFFDIFSINPAGFNKEDKIDKGPIRPPNCTVLDSRVYDNFILADEPFTTALHRFETCRSDNNNNLCRKSASSLESPITFDQKFRVTSVPAFIFDFNLFSCELDNFTFKVFFFCFFNKERHC